MNSWTVDSNQWKTLFVTRSFPHVETLAIPVGYRLRLIMGVVPRLHIHLVAPSGVVVFSTLLPACWTRTRAQRIACRMGVRAAAAYWGSRIEVIDV